MGSYHGFITGRKLVILGGVLGLLGGCTGGLSQRDETTPPPLTGTITRSEVRIKEKWRPILKIQSQKPQKTPYFKISGKEWKIHWQNKANGELIVILYDESKPDYSEVLVNVSTADEDVIFLTGKGRYRLEVMAKQPYEILVEELR
jgi:hypothetical protein